MTDISAEQSIALFEALISGLDDYTVDERGDVLAYIQDLIDLSSKGPLTILEDLCLAMVHPDPGARHFLQFVHAHPVQPSPAVLTSNRKLNASIMANLIEAPNLRCLRFECCWVPVRSRVLSFFQLDWNDWVKHPRPRADVVH